MFLGIDVSKSTLDAALLKEGGKPRHKVFSNDAAGHTALIAWLCEHASQPVHACLEATGTWAQEAALALHRAGHLVSLVNPARTHAFGKSQLKRTKTDKADAILIGEFCRMHNPPVWTPQSPQVQQLQGLVRRLEHLEEMQKMEENRLASGGLSSQVEESLQEHIGYLAHQIEKTRRQIKDHPPKGHPARTPTSKASPNCSKAFPASELRPPLCCWPNWATSRTLAARAKSRPSRAWCRASANRTPRCVAAHGFPKSVLRACASRFTFLPSLLYASIR